ncbi:MAG: hypothetical protein PHE27_00765, partial [Alphaproteobacteria bacterium]|nr:hypothetical protein [Alphaproteobacteria bacterium]
GFGAHLFFGRRYVSGRYGLTASNLGSLSVAILKGSSDPTIGTAEVFKALSTIGDTTQVAQFPMTTLNNHPVSRRVGIDRAYIAGINSITATGTGTSTSYTPVISTIHSGFSLQLTPRLLDDGRILLQYSLGLIGIEDMGETSFLTNDDATGTSAQKIYLPVTDNRIFIQQSMLRSGQTLMIGGIDRTDMTQNKQGIGSPDNFLLGGGTSSNETHLMMIIAISPQVMDVGADGDEERR